MKSKNHSLKPQDILVALRLHQLDNKDFSMRSLSNDLSISLSEVSNAISRLEYCELVSYDRKSVNLSSLIEFIIHGIRYAFPTKPGAIQRGIPTSYSQKSLKGLISSEEIIVWPSADGSAKGTSIEPLYSSVTRAIIDNEPLHRLLALIDMIRVGRAREKQIAIKILKEELV